MKILSSNLFHKMKEGGASAETSSASSLTPGSGSVHSVCLNIIDEVTLGPGTTAAAVWCLHHVTDNPANKLVLPPLCPLLSPSFLSAHTLFSPSVVILASFCFFSCSSVSFFYVWTKSTLCHEWKSSMWTPCSDGQSDTEWWYVASSSYFGGNQGKKTRIYKQIQLSGAEKSRDTMTEMSRSCCRVCCLVLLLLSPQTLWCTTSL